MVTLRKKPDWLILFDEFMDKNRSKRFIWGSWDCVLFSNSFIKYITGNNLLPKEWKWKNEEEAIKSIKKFGKNKGLAIAIDNACKKVKGIERIDPMYISKGDLVVYKEETELCGISDGFKVLTPSKRGLASKNDINIVGVWRINV